MNGRISKLLRKVSKDTGIKVKHLKKDWNNIPWNRRHKIRKMLEEKVSQSE